MAGRARGAVRSTSPPAEELRAGTGSCGQARVLTLLEPCGADGSAGDPLAQSRPARCHRPAGLRVDHNLEPDLLARGDDKWVLRCIVVESRADDVVAREDQRALGRLPGL